MATPRQVQDFRNGFSFGYREGRYGETALNGTSVSAETADGKRLGMIAGRARTTGDSGSSALDLENATAAQFDAESIRNWRSNVPELGAVRS